MTRRHVRKPARAPYFAALLLLLGNACVEDPEGHQQSLTVAASTDKIADGECADITITFRQVPPSGQSVELTTTVGLLNPDATADADKRKLTLTTATSKTLSARVCAGSKDETGRITARASGLDPAQSDALTVKLAEVVSAEIEAVFLSTAEIELRAPTATTSTLELQLIPTKPKASITGRVGLLACCDVDSTSAGGSADALCDSKLTVPPFVDVTSDSSATARATLTADGRAFTRTDGELRERDVTIHAYVPTDTSATCADLLVKSDKRWKQSSVVLRLTTRDPSAEPEEEEKQPGEAGAAGG
jgi:hypothetical protein